MERQPDFNKYIGIPYKPAGRDVTGIDCYGLVRLVQKEQFGIELPSFDTEYDGNDEARLEELIKQYKEGWEQIDKPEAGSVVLFSVLGYESHIGIAVDSESFLHVRENMDSVIEPFSTSRWNKRIVGHFKYSEKAAANLTAIPHPLKTETYTIPVPVGTTVAKLVESINKEYNVEPELKSRIYVAINGVPVKQEDWETKVIGKDDVITYRTLPGKGVVRTLAVLALAVLAPHLAGLAEFAYMGTAAATIGGATAVYGLTYAAVMVGGMALIDKIAPIRPPAEPTDPGSSERQLMVNGGQNQANPYGAIPVVLGKVRMTAQLASKNYLTFENERDSYLSMLLYWGYGPLSIDRDSYKFGDVSVDNFSDKIIKTQDRIVEFTPTEIAEFDAIYGKDVDQVVLNQELVCDGNPELGGGGAYTITGVYDSTTDQTVISRSFSRKEIIWDQPFEAIFTVTGGASTWADSCLRVADLVRTNLSATQVRITGRLQPGGLVGGPAVVALIKAGNNVPVSGEISLTTGPTVVKTVSSYYDAETDYTKSEFAFSSTDVRYGQNFEAVFTVNSSTDWIVNASGASNVILTKPSSTTVKVTGALRPSPDTLITIQKRGSHPLPTGTATAKPISPGPWFLSTTTQSVDSVGISLHFPQGLRRIVTQGDGAGGSEGANCIISVQRSSDGINWTNVDTFNAAPTVDRQVTQPAGWVWNPTGGDEGNGRMELVFRTTTIQEPVAKKDAFTITKSYNRFTDNLDSNAFKYVRVRRETGDNTEDNSSYRYYHQAILHNVAFTTNTKPAIDPPNCKIAKTAIKIKASDQLNGSVEGFNAIVQTIAPVWNGTDWNTQAATSNPASLMIYVLTHPANPRRKTLNNIDLTNLANFYNYCQTKGFEYNAVLGSQRSLLDVLRDICAAGRGSPALKDGKWSVTIDEPKAQIVQMFTPHNSWGFEGVKNLPDIPHGLRVRYYDQDQSYQEAEIIVYNTGYSEANASLFESITLPGVTKKSLVIDHARWHMAQAKLRPEVYSFNADIEYIVANRGDRVKVMHDVPMWGLGSGRVKNRISNTVLELDEPVPMEVGKNYMLRTRSKTGAMITRSIVVATADGYYDEITLTASTTQAEADALDLFMFGENQQEGQDLLIISVEPTSSKSARITCVDYGVTDTYNIFTDYLTLTENVVFESQITLPGSIQVNAFGDKKPTITFMRSDETVMQRSTTGSLQSVINVSYLNASNLPPNTVQVHAEYDISAATDNTNVRTVVVDYIKGNIVLPDVVDGEEYKVRLRYVSNDGRVGLWTDYTNHVVVGKTTPPPVFDYVDVETTEDGTRQYYFGYFEGNKPIDWKGAEIRYSADLNETNFSKMIPLQNTTTFYTGSPVELSIPQEGVWRFAFRSIDTSDLVSAPVFIDVSLGKPMGEAVIGYFDEQTEGWPGQKTNLMLESVTNLPDYLLGAGDYVWTSPVSWDNWQSVNRWTGVYPSTATYVSPVRDIGRLVTGEFRYRLSSDGETLVEIQTSTDGVAWSAWFVPSSVFTTRYLRTRVTLTADDSEPIVALFAFSYSLSLRLSSEDINDLDISTLTGANRIGVGDVRVPLSSPYAYIQKIIANVVDSSAGAWSVQIIDKNLSGWRFQFKLDGVLTDPNLVDFYIEGTKI